MNNYKKGDKVRVLECAGHPGFDFNGYVGVLDRVDHEDIVLTKPAPCGHDYFGSPEIEPLEPERTVITFENCRVGDRVTDSDEDEDVLCVLDRTKYLLALSDRNKPDVFGSWWSKTDLETRQYEFIQSNLTPKKMTLKEISKELGYDIIIKKEKK